MSLLLGVKSLFSYFSSATGSVFNETFFELTFNSPGLTSSPTFVFLLLSLRATSGDSSSFFFFFFFFRFSASLSVSDSLSSIITFFFLTLTSSV